MPNGLGELYCGGGILHIGTFKDGTTYGHGIVYKIVSGERIKILEGIFNGKNPRIIGKPNSPNF